MKNNSCKTEKLIKAIGNHFITLEREITWANSINLTDINIYMENLVLKMLILLNYGEFVDSNVRNSNNAGFDLDDEKLVIQVTSTISAEKIKKGIERSKKKIKNRKFKVFYLNCKSPKRRKGTFKDYDSFEPSRDQLCFFDMLNKAKQLDKLKELFSLLESELNVDIPTVDWLKENFQHQVELSKNRYNTICNEEVEYNQKLKCYLTYEKNENVNNHINLLSKTSKWRLCGELNGELDKYEKKNELIASEIVRSINEFVNEVEKCFIDKNFALNKNYFDFIREIITQHFENCKSEFRKLETIYNMLENVMLLDEEIKKYLSYQKKFLFSVTGKKGYGKTHLMFELAEHMLDKNYRVYIITARQLNNGLNDIKHTQLGEVFTFENIVKSLNLDNNFGLFIIDGINEGNYIRENYNDFLTALHSYKKKYLNVKFIISYPNENHDEFNNNDLFKFSVKPFSSINVDSTLNYYNVRSSKIKYHALFLKNPMYLFMLCRIFENKSIENKFNLENLCEEYIKKIKTDILKSVDRSTKKRYEFNSIVNKALDIIVFKLHEKNTYSICIDDLKNQDNDIYDVINLFKDYALLEQYGKRITFTYDTIYHYLIAKLLIDEKKRIDTTTDLYRVATYLPLSHNQEIYEYSQVNSEITEEYIECAFLYSLGSRYCEENVSEKTLIKINEIIDYLIIESKDKRYKDNLHTEKLSEKISHICDGAIINNKILESFHSRITEMSNPQRDIIFTLYYNQIGLLDTDNSILSIELLSDKILLEADSIVYFHILVLSSSNRSLRDTVTKKMVVNFLNNLEILLKVINSYFLNFNDEYVVERILAIILGVISNEEHENLYKKIFYIIQIYSKIENYSIRRYITHILRIINSKDKTYKINFENKHNLNCIKNGFVKLFELNSYVGDSIATGHDGHSGYYGDWGRYYFKWHIRNVVVKNNVKRKDFINKLSDKQMKIIDEYENPKTKMYNIAGILLPMPILPNLEEQLNKDLIQQYNMLNKGEYCNPFDSKELENYISSIIMNFLGEFISNENINELVVFKDIIKHSYRGRHDHKIERISKKYQWIAYYNYLEVLSSRYMVKNEYTEVIKSFDHFYDGFYFDIDPTILYDKKKIGFVNTDKIIEMFRTNDIDSWDVIPKRDLEKLINIEDGYINLIPDINFTRDNDELWLYSVPFVCTNSESDYLLDKYIVKKTGGNNALNSIPCLDNMIITMNDDQDLAEVEPLIIKYEMENEYNYSKDLKSLYLLNRNVLKIITKYRKGEFFNNYDEVITKYLDINELQSIFLKKTFMEEELETSNRKLYYYVTYGKWKNRGIRGKSCEKIFCILYEFNLKDSKLKMINGYKYILDQFPNKYFSILDKIE